MAPGPRTPQRRLTGVSRKDKAFQVSTSQSHLSQPVLFATFPNSHPTPLSHPATRCSLHLDTGLQVPRLDQGVDTEGPRWRWCCLCLGQGRSKMLRLGRGSKRWQNPESVKSEQASILKEPE